MQHIVRFFYNTKGIGDTLLLRLSNQEVASFIQSGELCELFDQDHQLLGLNIAHASNHFTSLENVGYFYNHQTMKEVNQLLLDQGKQEVEVDLECKFKVGIVSSCLPHPKSTYLSCCVINTQESEYQVVCGANNVKEKMRVVLAKVGAVLPDGTFIEKSNLMGMPSYGMLCSFKELGIPSAESGIISLDDTYMVGSTFYWKG